MMNTMINDMMNGGMGIPMMGGMIFGITLWILLLAVLVWALITWLNRRWREPGERREFPSPKEPTAREILEQRYRGGEVDDATGEKMRAQLQVTNHPQFPDLGLAQ